MNPCVHTPGVTSTTTATCDNGSEAKASSTASPDAGSNPPPTWDVTDGSSKGPCPGSPAAADSTADTNARPTTSWPSPASPAPSSATADSPNEMTSNPRWARDHGCGTSLRCRACPHTIQYEDDPPPCDAPHLTPRADPPRITGQPLASDFGRVCTVSVRAVFEALPSADAELEHARQRHRRACIFTPGLLCRE
jgi:hypothetical protein